MMAKKSSPDEPDDAALLAHVFKDVTPLPGRKIAPQPLAPKTQKPSRRQIRPQPRNQATAAPASPSLPTIGHGDAPGVDKRTAQRLKRGQTKIEARLDLHGHRQDEARRALDAFLGGAAASGKRCVLIITGKGPVSQGGGVLREMVPRWLNEAPNRQQVLSFSHATPADGGTGALYVLLKRRRV